MANTLKPTLDARIYPNQASFILGRQIHDNIIFAQEMLLSIFFIKKKKEEREALWPLKLTLKKPMIISIRISCTIVWKILSCLK